MEPDQEKAMPAILTEYARKLTENGSVAVTETAGVLWVGYTSETTGRRVSAPLGTAEMGVRYLKAQVKQWAENN
jgi:hypothetical protein